VHFDATITLGNLISFVVFLGTMAKLHMDNRERLVKIEAKMDIIWTDFQDWIHGRLPPDRWKG